MDKKTPLHEQHERAGARIVPFAGYLMPIQYAGIIEEHQAVRQAMGMFDLSHMGEFTVTGKDALAAIDSLMTNDVSGLDASQIRYTPMCYPDGGIVDDLLVYRFADQLMLVVNAANISTDLAWIRDNVSPDISVEDVSDETALIAVQGPNSAAFLQRFTDAELAHIDYYHFSTDQFAGVQAVISRTGYTGEDGFELYLKSNEAPAVWQELLEAGMPDGLKPVGLGARDTLRLEAGYMLYGNDIDATTSPLEAGLNWTVKFGDSNFVGREALERQKAEGVRRRLMAFEMLDRSIPRAHFSLFRGEQQIGEATSGTYSPTFGRGIGLGYVQVDAARPGTEINIDIRAQPHPAKLVRKPIYKRDGG